MTRAQVDRNNRGPNILPTIILCGVLLFALTFGYAYLHYLFVGRYANQWVTPASRHADTFFRWVWLGLMGLTVVLGFLHLLGLLRRKARPTALAEADFGEIDAPIVCRKHPFAYVITVLATVFWISVFTLVYLPVHSAVLHAIWNGQASAFDDTIVSWVWLGLVGIALSIGLLSWKQKSHIVWTAAKDALILDRGWLYWQRGSFSIPYNTVFEAYYSQTLIPRLFRIDYGTVSVKRTTGTAETWSQTFMANPVGIVRAINKKVGEPRTDTMQPVVAVAVAPNAGPSKSASEQLSEIAALKASGTITEEEFALMKKRIINGA